MHPTTNAHKLDPTVPCSILTSRVAGKKALDRVNCLVFCGAPFMSSSWTSAEEQQQQFRAAASATGRGTAKQWLLVARPEFRSEIGNYVTNLCLVFNMKVSSLPPLHFFHPFIHPPFNPPPHRRHRHQPPAPRTALCCCYAICWCTRQSTR